MKLAELKKKIAAYAAKEGLIAVYLFGSTASGKRHQLSDLDIAVLLSIPPADYFSKRLQMTVDLMKLLRQDEVDLVILNQAPPLLQYQVITQGKIIYCRDALAKARFEAHAIVQYLDFKPILDLQFEHLKRRLKEGKFGVRPRYYPRTPEKA